MALSKDDWIRAGLEALAEGGLDALAVEPVARRLGTTKGSFYWHFAGRDELLAAVLGLWEERETTQVVAGLAALPTPRARLEALGRSAYTRAAGDGPHAALLAAADDPRIAPTLERITEVRLGVLERLYGELGLDDAAAGRQARLAYALYLGTAELRRVAPGRTPAEDGELDRQVRVFVDAVLPDV